MSAQSKPQSRTQSREGASRGTGRAKPAEAKNEPLVRSVLIEPRRSPQGDNEPPRISVSVEYSTHKAPDVNAMRRAAIKELHNVVKVADEGKMVDVGERQDVIRCKRTQTFSLEDK